jgi:hypothetical protein
LAASHRLCQSGDAGYRLDGTRDRAPCSRIAGHSGRDLGRAALDNDIEAKVV